MYSAAINAGEKKTFKNKPQFTAIYQKEQETETYVTL